MKHRTGFYNLLTNTKYSTIADNIIKLYDMVAESLENETMNGEEK